MKTTTSQPDLLFFFSDQHDGRATGYAGHPEVKTPHLDRLAEDGVAFQQAYTSCPLCVPARCSLLSGQLTSRIGVYSNGQTFHSEQTTFLHALTAAGYETVLCGRMHFVGQDQRHGFSKRICGDITPPNHGCGLGVGDWERTFTMLGCTHLGGGGESPVLAYDRAVVQAARDYLAQDHDRPQCVVVGTYGPHFTYLAPPELFDQYHGNLQVPASWDPDGNDENPVNDAKRQRRRTSFITGEESPVTTDIMLALRASYFGMITEQDRLVGDMRESWNAYLKRRDRKGVFLYASDHGDTCGEHGIFGKQTFYEGSVRIPCLAAGDGLAEGVQLETPISLMDIGPTLCDLGDAPTVPDPDGRSLKSSLQSGREPEERPVLSEWYAWWEERIAPARMLRRGDWKLIHYSHSSLPDQLFNVTEDPDELKNLMESQPDTYRELLALLQQDWDPEAITRQIEARAKHLELIEKAAANIPPEYNPSDKWNPPPELIEDPKGAVEKWV